MHKLSFWWAEWLLLLSSTVLVMVWCGSPSLSVSNFDDTRICLRSQSWILVQKRQSPSFFSDSAAHKFFARMVWGEFSLTQHYTILLRLQLLFRLCSQIPALFSIRTMEKKMSQVLKKEFLCLKRPSFIKILWLQFSPPRLLNERLILPIQKLPHQILLVHPASGVTGVTMRTSLQELQRHYF